MLPVDLTKLAYAEWENDLHWCSIFTIISLSLSPPRLLNLLSLSLDLSLDLSLSRSNLRSQISSFDAFWSSSSSSSAFAIITLSQLCQNISSFSHSRMAKLAHGLVWSFSQSLRIQLCDQMARLFVQYLAI